MAMTVTTENLPFDSIEIERRENGELVLALALEGKRMVELNGIYLTGVGQVYRVTRVTGTLPFTVAE